jgi:hypothetical protein
MKVKILLVASAGMFFVISGGFTGCKQPVQTFTADSPLDMGGGSIYADVKNGQTWPQGCDKKCTATSNNIGLIFPAGVIPTASYPPTPPQPLNGWVMKISNRHKNQNEKNDAVRICSNQSCDGNDLGDGHTIYLETRGDSRWTLHSATELRFHDNDCDGDTGTSEDKDCDFFEKVRIEHPEGTPVWVGKCKGSVGEGHCSIGIGKP